MENPFIKRPYSREAYDEQEREVKEAERAANENPGHSETETIRGGEYESYGAVEPFEKEENRWVKSPEMERYSRAREKLEKMKQEGHKEALELETKHRRLVQAIEDARQSLYDFEKDKLSMRSE